MPGLFEYDGVLCTQSADEGCRELTTSAPPPRGGYTADWDSDSGCVDRTQSKAPRPHSLMSVVGVLRVAVFSRVRAHVEPLVAALAISPDLEAVAMRFDTPDMPAEVLRAGPDLLLIDASTVTAAELLMGVAFARQSGCYGLPSLQDPAIEGLSRFGACGFASRAATPTDLWRLARALVLREAIPQELETIRIVPQTRPTMARSLFPAPRRLTSRELQIASAILCGMCNKEISDLHRITVATVKNHVHSILLKLELRQRRELTTSVASLLNPSVLPGPRRP
ncbi:hypothetical protein PLCT1_00030 [Planctomycetaceae bacterium]|nr:hypothetical protein PLCT1_00030 [Planctomycetaceae bacterium]